MPNSLGRSQIIVRVGGLGLEKTGTAGSGQPGHLEGKLAGAVAATLRRPGAVGAAVTAHRIDACDRRGRCRARKGPARAAHASPGGFADFAAALAPPEDERLLALARIVDARPAFPSRAASASLLAPVSTGFPVDTLGRWSADLARLGPPLASGTLPALPGSAVQTALRERAARRSSRARA